jgi:hypothetical protein
MNQDQLTQWEYCEIRQNISRGIMHEQYILFYRAGNNQTIEERFTNREAAIAQLGLEGWEMVGVAGSFEQNSGGFRVFFKRPLLQK